MAKNNDGNYLATRNFIYR